jgi:hypothetical protein
MHELVKQTWSIDLTARLEQIRLSMGASTGAQSYNSFIVGYRNNHTVEFEEVKMVPVPYFVVHAVKNQFPDPSRLFDDHTADKVNNAIVFPIGGQDGKYAWKALTPDTKILTSSHRASKRSIMNLTAEEKRMMSSLQVWFASPPAENFKMFPENRCLQEMGFFDTNDIIWLARPSSCIPRVAGSPLAGLRVAGYGWRFW